MIWIAFGIIAMLLALIAVILIRAFAFVPQQDSVGIVKEICVDSDKAVADLSQMIQCKTVSSRTPGVECEAEFNKFKALMPQLFPRIYASCECEEVGSRALLYRYRGESELEPTVLMAHFDVVEANEDEWDEPPFSGSVKNGLLWGRGTIDTKITLNGAMQALESLIAEGFVPKRDVYLAFAGDEEVNGNGAPMIVNLFCERGIIPGAVIDEGGAVVQNAFPGVEAPCAVVGIGEKGMLNADFTFKGKGGHASSPAPHTPIGRLSAACVRIESHPFNFRLPDATRMLFDKLGRHSSFAYRLIFANLWLFAPVIDLISRKSGGEINALVRTTCAFTQMEGSKGMNVIPPKASMVANLRIIPGETCESVLARLKRTVNDPDIEIAEISGMDPSVTSRVGTVGWKKLERAITDTWPGVVVSPYLMFACSDSRHWGRISDRVYRFSPMALTAQERASIHGNNECISVEKVAKTVEFYKRLISEL